jgi:hypothetical protein
MRVGLTYWGPPSCERLLYSCCIGVIHESNPQQKTPWILPPVILLGYKE